MSDDKTPPAANGAAATDHPDSAVVPKLRAKIQVLEQDLVNEKVKIKNLEDEISSHESDKRALNSIAARAFELETQFSSLQHNVISCASEFEAKERENVEKMNVIELERNLLLEKLKESEEKIRELQTPEARKIEVLDREVVEGLSKLMALKREIADRFSEREARDRKKMDQLSELEARVEVTLLEKSDKIKELEARLKETEREKLDKVSELEAKLEATEREKSDKIRELEARLEEAEREKRIKLIH